MRKTTLLAWLLVLAAGAAILLLPPGGRAQPSAPEGTVQPLEEKGISTRLGGKEVFLGQTESQLKKMFGAPDRVNRGMYGLDWHVFHRDYACFLMAAVEQGQVCGYYTNAPGFAVEGNIRFGEVFEEDPPGVTLYRDSLDGQKIYAVLVLPEERRADGWDNVSRAYLETQAMENFDITNAFRVSRGLPPLQWDSAAAVAARLHGLNMAREGYFSHTSQDGRSPVDRYLAVRQADWKACGENIAGGMKTGVDNFHGWLNSQGHRENLLSEKFTHLGVGAVYLEGSQYGYYFGQTFVSFQ